MKNDIKNSFNSLNLCDLIMSCQSFSISVCNKDSTKICELSEYEFIIKSEKLNDE